MKKYLPWLVLAIPLVGFLLFPSSGHDDSHISFWESYALVHFGDLLNVNGVRLEQSSSLLWVLLCAALYKITSLSLPTLGGILSIVFGVLLVERSGRLARRLSPEYALPVQLLVALNPSIIFWSFSGMETTLAAWLLVGLVDATIAYVKGERGPLLAALFIFSILLARSEAPLTLSASFLAIALGGLLVKRSPRRALGLLAITLSGAALVFAWRHHHFGAFFPLPTEAKTARDKGQLVRGVEYILLGGAGATSLLVLLMGARGAEFAIRKTDDLARLTVLAFGLAQLAFVTTAGGDWMIGGRFFVAMLPLATLVAVDVVWKWRRWAIPAIALLHVVGLGRLTHSVHATLFSFPRDDRPYLAGKSFFERYHWDHRNYLASVAAAEKAVDDVEKKTGRKAILMSKCAGVPFYYMAKDRWQKVEFLDFQGLSSAHFTRCPLVKKMRHDYLGVRISYRTYSEMRGELEKVCGIPQPDILWDYYSHELEPDREEVFEKMGYQIVDKEENENLPGEGVMVAVRKDLL